MYVSMSTVYRYHELALDSFDELLKIDSWWELMRVRETLNNCQEYGIIIMGESHR
jgi:hypothetical protein